MKKSVVATLVVVFVVFAFGAFAATTPATAAARPAASQTVAKTGNLMGSVSSIDEKTMSFVVTNADGKDTTVFWNKGTKVTGGKLAAGEHVDVTWVEKDGKNWASAVKIETQKAAAKH